MESKKRVPLEEIKGDPYIQHQGLVDQSNTFGGESA